MKERIGMLIWKEMNKQGLSHGNFVKAMRHKNVYLKDFFKMETIDVNSLIQISVFLKTNFFQFFEPDDLITVLKSPEMDAGKTTSIQDIVKTQHKLLLAHKKIIMQQDNLIVQLTNHYSEK
ncbi:MAG: hypothetical protein ABWY16_17655 [Pedobacter sp.]|uniref:hypothetical protein n=1 Tax=Pedobacter sp. TaxID=1411316 RepID=UPI003397A4C9